MKKFTQIFTIIALNLILIWMVIVSNNQIQIKQQLNRIETTQDSLHTYYKFNHLHHYQKCTFDGDDLEGEN